MTKTVRVSIQGVEFEIPSGETDRQAAWELFVELSTRATTYPLEHGLLREALNSLYQFIQECRLILRKYGPEIGKGKGSVGYLSISMINGYLRPFLSKWHPALQSWEATYADGSELVSHEQRWPEVSTCRDELAELRTNLDTYRSVLGQIADVES